MLALIVQSNFEHIPSKSRKKANCKLQKRNLVCLSSFTAKNELLTTFTDLPFSSLEQWLMCEYGQLSLKGFHELHTVSSILWLRSTARKDS